MPSIAQLIQLFQQQHESARGANEERYRELRRVLDTTLDTFRGRFRESMDLMSSLGEQERTRAREATDIASARDEQDLISRGLGSSTLLTAQRRRRDKDYDRYSQDVLAQVSRQKAGQLTEMARLEASIFDRMASAIEGRTDMGPDMGQLASLIAQASSKPGSGGVSYNRPGMSLRESLKSKWGQAGGAQRGEAPVYNPHGASRGGAPDPGGGYGAGASRSARYQDPFAGGMAFMGNRGYVMPGGVSSLGQGAGGLGGPDAPPGGGGTGTGGEIIQSGFWKGKTREEAERLSARYS